MAEQDGSTDFPSQLRLMKVGQRKGEEEEGEFGLGQRR